MPQADRIFAKTTEQSLEIQSEKMGYFSKIVDKYLMLASPTTLIFTITAYNFFNVDFNIKYLYLLPLLSWVFLFISSIFAFSYFWCAKIRAIQYLNRSSVNMKKTNAVEKTWKFHNRAEKYGIRARKSRIAAYATYSIGLILFVISLGVSLIKSNSTPYSNFVTIEDLQ